jgi:hypothetical protein
MEHGLNSRGANDVLKEGGGVKHNGDRAAFNLRGLLGPLIDDRQEIWRNQALGGQNAIHGVQGEMAAAAQEVGDVGLAQPGLPSQERDAESPPLDPSEQFQAKSFVHLGKVHLWKIRHQQWGGRAYNFPRKTH